MTETENHSTGPRTEEGKQRSSQNAIKHGLFAKLLLLPGESQEQFDALLNGFKENHKPHGATEDSLVYRLAEIHWRLGRIPNLEALAIEKAIETGDTDGKFLSNYSLYSQRLNRDFQSTLKTLHQEQAKRLVDHGRDFRIAVILYDYYTYNKLPWNPADDGFVFSKELLAKQLAFNQVFDKVMETINMSLGTKEMDERFAKEAL
jgi:hypothetical protein